jgi:hypothetical protein
MKGNFFTSWKIISFLRKDKLSEVNQLVGYLENSLTTRVSFWAEQKNFELNYMAVCE